MTCEGDSDRVSGTVKKCDVSAVLHRVGHTALVVVQIGLFLNLKTTPWDLSRAWAVFSNAGEVDVLVVVTSLKMNFRTESAAAILQMPNLQYIRVPSLRHFATPYETSRALFGQHLEQIFFRQDLLSTPHNLRQLLAQHHTQLDLSEHSSEFLFHSQTIPVPLPILYLCCEYELGQRWAWLPHSVTHSPSLC
jgi:hypothetical protein